MEISLERLLQKKHEGGQRLEEVFKDWKKSGLKTMEETLLYGVHRFFCSPEDYGTLQGCCSSTDSMFACAHGDCECLRLDACAGFMERMELAL